MRQLQRPLYVIHFQKIKPNYFGGVIIRNDVRSQSKINTKETIYVGALDLYLVKEIARILDRDWDEQLQKASFNATSRVIGQIEMLIEMDTKYASTNTN